MVALVSGIQKELLSFAQELIGETLTDCNDMLKNSAKRRNAWHIVKTVQKQLLTPHERMTEDAKAKPLEDCSGLTAIFGGCRALQERI